MIATFHASGRPATVSHRIGDGLQRLLRPIAWSFGLALAILLLMAPTTAKAADPDDGGSLLGGLTGGLADVVEPVADVVEPVAQEPANPPVSANAEPVTALVTPLPDPVEQVVEPVVEPIVQPVAGIVAPVLEPVGETIEPVTQPLVDRLDQPITAITEPVTNLVTPVVEPIDGLVEGLVEPVVQPMLQPVSGLVGPALEPITGDLTSEPSAGGDPESGAPRLPRVSAPVSVPTPPSAGIELPGFMPIAPPAPGDDVVSEPGGASEAPVRLGPGTTDPVAIVTDVGRLAALQVPPATDPGFAGPSPDPDSATPWWTRLGPIASFGGVGSGQTLNGFAFGVGAGLCLLLLLLLPPPFRVSRLHLAAVFWRPQRSVGPLVPPG
jgi:hypothetical protein